MIPWIDKYIGIPYKKWGRSIKGVDCYGLVYLVCKNELGREDLPEFLGDYDDKESIKDLISKNIPLLAGDPTDIPDVGDIAVFNFCNMPIHMAVYVGRGRVLHTLLKSETCVESISSVRLKGRLHGYYKLR